MKLTPLDLRKQQFRKVFRGYDPDEVGGFIQKLSQDWEEVLEERRRAEERVEQAELKLRHYEKVELALQEALEAARESARRAEDMAQQRAKLIVEEAELRAQRVAQDAEQERYTVRQDLVRLTTRQSEIAARLRAFLMSEMEILAQFQGDDPVGFIKLMAATEGGAKEALPAPRARLGPALLEPEATAEALTAEGAEEPRRPAAPVEPVAQEQPATPPEPAVEAEEPEAVPEAVPEGLAVEEEDFGPRAGEVRAPLAEEPVARAEEPAARAEEPEPAPPAALPPVPVADPLQGTAEPLPPPSPLSTPPLPPPAPTPVPAQPERRERPAPAPTYRDWLSGLAARRQEPLEAPREGPREAAPPPPPPAPTLEREGAPLPFGRSFFRPPAEPPTPSAEPVPGSDAAQGWSLRSLITGGHEEEPPSVVASDDERERIRRILEDLD